MKQPQVTLWSAVVVAGRLGWTPAAVAAADLQKVIENGKPPAAMVRGGACWPIRTFKMSWPM